MPSIDPRLPPEESQSGITELASGERYIAASRRPDGSTRKEIKVRPGYRPPEDVAKYKNRTAEAWKNRGNGGVPGAAFEEPSISRPIKPKPSRKPAAKGASSFDGPPAAAKANGAEVQSRVEAPSKEETPVDPEADKEREARKLSKKLRQARELQQKKEKGGALLPEQFQKVIQMNELIRQLDSLGFDQEGERKDP